MAGDFGGRGRSDLFFFDRVSGRAALCTIEDDGRLATLHEHASLDPAWSRLVAGDFGGGAGTDLLLYDRAAGRGEFRALDDAGRLMPFGEHGGWRRAAPTPFEARYHAPGDPGTNIVLATGLAAAEADWGGPPHNGPAWTLLSRDATWRHGGPRRHDRRTTPRSAPSAPPASLS